MISSDVPQGTAYRLLALLTNTGNRRSVSSVALQEILKHNSKNHTFIIPLSLRIQKQSLFRKIKLLCDRL